MTGRTQYTVRLSEGVGVPVGARVPCDRDQHVKRRSTKGCAHDVGLEFDRALRRARIMLDGAAVLSLTANEYSALEQIIVRQYEMRTS